MSGPHEPREEFVNQLELQLRADLRRRQLAAGARSWMPRSIAATALAAAAVAIVSMALGGGIVAASYEARLTEQRDLLLTTFEQRALLAKQQLALASQQLKTLQERVAIGIEPQESVHGLQFKVNEAEAELKTIELDIAEIKATGREPMQTMSAPQVGSRDFVTERWRVEMGVPASALTLEKSRMQALRKRVDVGLAAPMDVDTAQTRVIELESAVEVIQRKIAIRQSFLKGELPAAVADMRGLEVETDLRRTTLARRIELARRQVKDLQTKIEAGTVNPLALAESKLQLQQLELDMTKAEYELALIRKQLGK
jgi:hypothetical protein